MRVLLPFLCLLFSFTCFAQRFGVGIEEDGLNIMISTVQGDVFFERCLDKNPNLSEGCKELVLEAKTTEKEFKEFIKWAIFRSNSGKNLKIEDFRGANIESERHFLNIKSNAKLIYTNEKDEDEGIALLLAAYHLFSIEPAEDTVGFWVGKCKIEKLLEGNYTIVVAKNLKSKKGKKYLYFDSHSPITVGAGGRYDCQETTNFRSTAEDIKEVLDYALKNTKLCF